MNPLTLFQAFLEYAGKGAAGLSELLTVIGPGIVQLAPDLEQIVTDVLKLATDAKTVFSSAASSVAAAVAAGKPAT